MPITFSCTKCGNKNSAPDAAKGKQGKCLNCGVILTVPEKSEDESSVVALTLADEVPAPKAPPASLTPLVGNEVRRGVTQAKFNEQQAAVFGFQIAVVCIAAGVWWKSWWVGLGSFTALVAMLMFRPVAIALCILFGIGWGVTGWAIGSVFDKDGSGAAPVMAIFGLLCGIGSNLAAVQHFKDSTAPGTSWFDADKREGR